MSPFHFCLSAAKNLSSFQLLPISLITDLLQLFLGLPLFLFPWGFQSRAAFGISPSSFLNVWPIHLNFLFRISKFMSSCPVIFHRSLLEIIFGHHILRMNCDRLPLNWQKIKVFLLFHTASSSQVGRNIQADSTVIFIAAHICNQTLDGAQTEKVPWFKTAVAWT